MFKSPLHETNTTNNKRLTVTNAHTRNSSYIPARCNKTKPMADLNRRFQKLLETTNRITVCHSRSVIHLNTADSFKKYQSELVLISQLHKSSLSTFFTRPMRSVSCVRNVPHKEIIALKPTFYLYICVCIHSYISTTICSFDTQTA